MDANANASTTTTNLLVVGTVGAVGAACVYAWLSRRAGGDELKGGGRTRARGEVEGDARAPTRARVPGSVSASVDGAASVSEGGTTTTTRRGRGRGNERTRKRKGNKGVDEDEDVRGGKSRDPGKAQSQAKGKDSEDEDEDQDARTMAAIVPGSFDSDAAGADAKREAASSQLGALRISETAPAAVRSSKSGEHKEKKKSKKKKPQQHREAKPSDERQDRQGDEDRDKEVLGGDGGVQVQGRTTTVHGDDSNVAASLSPSESLSASALASSHVLGRGDLRPITKPELSQPHAQAQVRPQDGQVRVPAPPSQPRENRSSLSLDTDSSWTHVDRRRLRTSASPRGVADATSSDLASTASDSPVANVNAGADSDGRGKGADQQRTLAEKLVPRPGKSAVDDMLEHPDIPSLARVMRVQPRAGERPVPGFSWDDYGDVVEGSVLVHDADQEDEGEWGIVKSRNRTRPSQTMTTTTVAASGSVAPETMTKKQRQNARKRELAKAAKAETEATRLEGLAKHKRELEQLRIIEQSRQDVGKRPSGGMNASVDDQGKLVWE